MKRSHVVTAVLLLAVAAAWADTLVYRDGKATKALQGRLVGFDKAKEVVVFSYLHIDRTGETVKAETRQLTLGLKQVVRVTNSKGKKLVDPKANRRRKRRAALAARAASRDARRHGWKTCRRCEGKGCPVCRETGVDLSTVKRPKFSASDANRLASFKAAKVRDLTAEMVVWGTRKKAPAWSAMFS